MRKRILTMLLAMLLIVASLPLETFASTEENIGERTNMELLNSVLQERPWVIETLIDGDVTNNPYAMIQTDDRSKRNLIMQYALNDCREHVGFAAVLSALEVYANAGDYVSDAGNNALDFIKSCYGLDSDESAKTVLDDIVASADELKYESIFNEVIKADYTTSWGESLMNEDSNLENLRQRGKVLKKIKSYQAALKDLIGLSYGGNLTTIVDKTKGNYGEHDVSVQDYTEHMLDAYNEDLKGFLHSSIKILDDDSLLTDKVEFTNFLLGVTICEKLLPEESNREIEELFKEYMLDDTMKVLGDAGKILELGSYQVDFAIMLGSLANQVESLAGTFSYVAEKTDDEDLKTVLNRYAKIAREAGNEKIINYEGLTSYIRNKKIVTNYVQKKIMEKTAELLNDYNSWIIGSGKDIYVESLADYISGIGTAVDLGVWLGNEATGLKDAAKRIFICVYINKAVKEIGQICNNDIEEYKVNPSEDRAYQIINELELLKKLRLYGNEMAYNSIKDQMDSPVAKIINAVIYENEDEYDYSEQWKNFYQSGIDILMGSSVYAIGCSPIKLSKDETLLIQSQTFDGKTLVYGSVAENGKSYRIAEIDKRVMGGLYLNDAVLSVNASSTDATAQKIFKNLYIPYIESNGASKINAYNGVLNFGEITNNGELSLDVGTETAGFFVSDKITNESKLEILSTDKREDGMLCYDLENKGTVTSTNVGIQVKGDLTNSGNIDGKVELCGNGQSAFIDPYFSYVSQQIIAGSGTISDLYINSTAELGVNVTGKQTITNVFSNPSTIIHNAKRLTVTGNCEIDGGYCYSGLTFRDYTTSQIVVLEGTGYICGDVTFGGNTIFLDGLDVTSECNTLNLGSFTRVAGDFVYESGTISGERLLHLCGDVNIKTQTPSLKYISLEGANPQTIQSTNALDLEELRNDNTSSNGVLIGSQIKVSDLIYTGSNALYRQGKNIILTSNAKADGDSINGSISALDWTCSNPIYITGTIFVSGSNAMQNGGSIQTNNYKQTSGSMEIADEGQIVVENDATINGSVTGGTIEVKGDIVAGAVINIGKLIMNGKTPQSFTNTASTIAKALAIDNNSKGGVTINSIINVTEQFKNNCKNLINGKKIQVGALSELEMKELAKGDMTVSDSWNIASGKEYTIPGTLNLLEGSTVTLQEGSVLSIDGNMVNNKASIVIKQGAVLNITEYTNCASGSITIEDGGTLYLGSDAKLSSTTIGGDGLLVVCGDLYNKNCTWNTPNLKIAGKVPQSISGDNISANDLILGNSSKSGITLLTKLQYQGKKQCNEGKVNGLDKISVMS